MKRILLSMALILPGLVHSQTSTEAEIAASYQARKKLAESSLLRNYPARNIGPTLQGGRIIDMDVNLKNTK